MGFTDCEALMKTKSIHKKNQNFKPLLSYIDHVSQMRVIFRYLMLGDGYRHFEFSKTRNWRCGLPLAISETNYISQSMLT